MRATLVTAFDGLLDKSARLVRVQLGFPLVAQTELRRVLAQILGVERLLIFVEQIVHGPKLVPGSLGSQSRHHRVRVQIGQGKCAKNYAQIVAHLRFGLLQNGEERARIGALEIAVVNQNNRRIEWPARVVVGRNRVRSRATR